VRFKLSLFRLGLLAGLGVGGFGSGGIDLGSGMIDRDGEGGLDIGTELDGDFVFAEILDRAGEVDFLAVDVVTCILELEGDVLVGDGAEALFLAFAGFEDEDELELAELASEFLSLVQFGGFALGTFAAEFLDLALGGQRGGSGVVLGDEKIAGVTGLDRNDVGFAAETFDFGFEDDFDGHRGNELRVNGAGRRRESAQERRLGSLPKGREESTPFLG